MAVFQLADRIKETSTIVGTGTATLLGAETGFRGFSTFPDGDTVYYVFEAIDANGVPTGQWETGVGTVGGVGTTLARTTPKQGSSGVATLVNFAAGTKNVFVDEIASASMQANSSDTQVLFNNAGVVGGFGSWNGSILDIDGLYRTEFTDTTTTAGGGFADGRAFFGSVTINPASQPTGTPVRRGLYLAIETASGNLRNFNTLSGGRFDVFHSGDGTVAHLGGFTSGVDSFGAGNIGDATAGIFAAYHEGSGIQSLQNGLSIAMGNFALGTVTEGIGLYISPPENSGGGTYTLYAHIKLDDLASVANFGTKQAINYADKFIVDMDGKLTVPAATLTPAAGVTALTVANVAQTASFPVLDLAQTWNNAGVDFKSVLWNVTDTTSAATSQAFEIQRAGSPMFRVGKNTTLFNPATWAIGCFGLYRIGTLGLGIDFQSSSIDFYQNSTVRAYINANGFIQASGNFYLLTDAGTFRMGVAEDLVLVRSAAATLQMGVNLNGAAPSQALQAANGITGTDRTGGNFTIASGKGTGAGAVSSIFLQTPTVLGSGTTAQSLTTRVTIDSSGIKATGYKSSDGSAGVTFGPAGVASITVKDGIVTAIS